MNYTHFMVQERGPGRCPICIDVVRPETGLSWINGETLEEVQERYPGAVLMTPEDYQQKHNDAMRSDPIEITEKQWYEALEVLPPLGLKADGLGTTFKMSEFTSGEMTGVYCRTGGKHYRMMDKYNITHAVIIQKCRQAKGV